MFSQTSRKIKSKLKVGRPQQDKPRMIRNTAAIQTGGILVSMFSLIEGKEVETLHPYDALM